MNNNKKILYIIVCTFLAIGFFSVFEYFSYVKTDNAQIVAHRILLSTKVTGYITAIHVDEGAHVKKGDVLVEVDKQDYQNSLNTMKAELKSIKARLSDARKNFNRYKTLFSEGAVSAQQRDFVLAGYEEILAKHQAVSAKVDQAQLNLEHTKIYAPADGFIAKKNVVIGQLVVNGFPAIGFVNDDERWVVANFKETQISKIKDGKKALIYIDAFPNKVFQGKVVNVGPATGSTFSILPIDNSSGNFVRHVQKIPVNVSLDNFNMKDSHLFKAGMFVKVKIEL